MIELLKILSLIKIYKFTLETYVRKTYAKN